MTGIRGGLLVGLALLGAGGEPAWGAEGSVAVELDTAGWSGALAGDTLLLAVRIVRAGGEEGMLGVRWVSSGGLEEIYPLPRAQGPDSLRCVIPLVAPYAEEGDSLVALVRRDSAGGEICARAAAWIGATTAGRVTTLAADAREVRDLRLRGSTLVLSGVETFRVWDLDAGTPIGGPARLGSGASPCGGLVLFERDRKIHRLDLATGDARLVSDPAFPSSAPAAGDSFSLWFRKCCGSHGELCVLPAEAEAFAFPIELPVAGPPALSGRRAAWVESDGESWAIRSVDLVERRVLRAAESADSLLPPAVGPGALAYARRAGSGWSVFVAGPDGSAPVAIRPASGSIRDPRFGDGFLVWREGRPGAWVLRGRALPEGRFFQVSPVLEDPAPFAVDDSSVVWIDGTRDMPVVRRLRVRVPRAGRPDIAFRVHASRVFPDRVVVEWSLEGDVGSGTFTALRADSGGAGGETEVARGEVLGPGTYSFEDTALPTEGGRQRVRYFVAIDLPSGSLRFGPVAVLLPGPCAEFALEPASANPALGEVVFALHIPPVPGPTPATMDVFDCSGRRIRSVDREAAAGRTRVAWDRRDDGGREVGPGVYFVRVRVGRVFSETRKVVLLS